MKLKRWESLDPSEVLRDLDAAEKGIQRVRGHFSSICGDAHDIAPPLIPFEQARAVRSYLRNRRMREHLMPPGLFGEPAWDILLDLYASEIEGRKVSISSACLASAVPATTALRWLNTLADFGLVTRAPDGSDARRANLELTTVARKSLQKWIQTALLEDYRSASKEVR